MPLGVASSSAGGHYVLSGRAKDTLVLTSGKNVEPAPIEDACAASPLIKHIMLLGQVRAPRTQRRAAAQRNACMQVSSRHAGQSNVPVAACALLGSLCCSCRRCSGMLERAALLLLPALPPSLLYRRTSASWARWCGLMWITWRRWTRPPRAARRAARR